MSGVRLSRVRRPALILSSCLISLPAVALAQQAPDASVALPPLVVSATRLPTPEDQLGSSVTVITAADIANTQARTLPDVLMNLPGLEVVQTGGPGGVASVYIRGTNTNHTKVLIDGIDVGDPASTNGSFDFSQILASDIARIEVLRGPQSGLYGSDAIGGVIDIITRQGSGPPKVTASAEGGSFQTFNQTAGVGGSTDRLDYALDLAHYHAGDDVVTPANLVGPGVPVNADVYDNKTASTKLGATLSDNLDVGLVARYISTSLLATSDDPFGAGPEPLRSSSDNTEFLSRATAHLLSFDGRLDQTVGLAYTGDRLRYFDPNPNDVAGGDDPSVYGGNRVKLDWQGNVRLVQGQTLVLGAEDQRETIDDTTPITAATSSDAGFAQLQSAFGDRLFDTVSVRYDDNGHFGSKATWRVAPSYSIAETGTRFKASLGTGFKAPTLDQLFDNYPLFGFVANPALRPETSVGYDAGFEQSLSGQRAQFGSTWFHNDIGNLIDYNSSFTSWTNVGRATTEGFESFASWRPLDRLTLRADHTFTLAEDDITHSQLPRRPMHKASLSATWQVTPAASVTSSVLYTGSWDDVNRAGNVNVTGSPYTLVDLAGRYDLGHGVSAFARIENLLDVRYQDPVGFDRPGLGVFAGLSVAFDGTGGTP